jgi:amidase
MKIVPRSKVIYSFSSQHKPVERVKPGELVLLKTEDALGGQVRDEETPLEELDWSRVRRGNRPGVH